MQRSRKWKQQFNVDIHIFVLEKKFKKWHLSFIWEPPPPKKEINKTKTKFKHTKEQKRSTCMCYWLNIIC